MATDRDALRTQLARVVNPSVLADAWPLIEAYVAQQLARPDADSRAVARLRVLRRIYAEGCPTYRSNDASRTRNDCLCCSFCHANLELSEPHAADCAWLDLEALVSP